MIGKPRIGIDIDGVIVEMSEGIRREAEKRFGVIYNPEDVTKFKLTHVGLNRRQTSQIIGDWEFLLSLPEIPYAMEAIELLWEDYEIHLVTARWSNVEIPTKSWIQSHNIMYDYLVMGQDLKYRYAEEKGLLWFVEDRYRNAMSLAEVCPTYLITQTYNMGRELHPNITRVNSWQELLGKIYADE